MKGTIRFEIHTDYERTKRERLEALAVNSYYSKYLKKYVWVFRLGDLKQVEKLMGDALEFNEADVVSLKSRCPVLSESVNIKNEKGRGYIVISTEPGSFILEWPQRKEPQRTKVSFEFVKALWGVISKQPLGVRVKTMTVAANHCVSLGITRFHRYNSNTFDKDKFKGTRKDYLKFYFALKVLEAQGAIKYHRSARQSGVSRLVESWSVQTKI